MSPRARSSLTLPALVREEEALSDPCDPVGGSQVGQAVCTAGSCLGRASPRQPKELIVLIAQRVKVKPLVVRGSIGFPLSS